MSTKTILGALVLGAFLLFASIRCSRVELDGKAVEHPPSGVDLVITPEAYETESNSYLEPTFLLRSGVAKRVLFKGQIYWLNGRHLASTPYSGATLPGAWTVAVAGTRRVGLWQKVTRVVALAPDGREMGFVENASARGYTWTARRPIGNVGLFKVNVAQVANIGDTTPDAALHVVNANWRDATPADAIPRIGLQLDPGCEPRVQARSDWASHLRFAGSELHIKQKVYAACIGQNLFVFQHEDEYALAINRFDIKSGRWLDVRRLPVQTGYLLHGVRPVRGSGDLEVVMGAWRDGRSQPDYRIGRIPGRFLAGVDGLPWDWSASMSAASEQRNR